MTFVARAAITVGRVALAVGGLGFVALLLGAASIAVDGPSSLAKHGGATFTLGSVAAFVVAGWLVWLACRWIVIRQGHHEDLLRLEGRDGDARQAAANRHKREPAGCLECGRRFNTLRAALDHAAAADGDEMTDDEIRSMVVQIRS